MRKSSNSPSKKCWECGIVKPKTAFYRHVRMKDGHLNQCKTCCEIARRKKLVDDPDWAEKESERHRKKEKNRYWTKLKGTEHHLAAIRKSNKRGAERYPEKRRASSAVAKKIPVGKGFNRHHWSYNEEHFLDVIHLTRDDHCKIHRFLKYRTDLKMYETKDGELLSTKEKHLAYIQKILENTK